MQCAGHLWNAVEQSLFSKVPLQILGHAMNMYNTALYAYGDDVRALNLEIGFFLEWISINCIRLLATSTPKCWRTILEWTFGRSWPEKIFLNSFTNFQFEIPVTRCGGFENWSYSIQNIDGSSVKSCKITRCFKLQKEPAKNNPK